MNDREHKENLLDLLNKSKEEFSMLSFSLGNLEYLTRLIEEDIEESSTKQQGEDTI